ncbi:MAG: HAD family hydrolase [Oscillospiraceae bacterium]|nr:HAD family hydrolase [Oscillospiraceae bacterium]
MFDVKLIVTDLDNTLLTSDKAISMYTADVLNKCKAKGIQIAFATARPERAVSRFISAVAPNFIISNNGATISQEGVLLYNKVISPNIISSLLHNFYEEKQIMLMTAEVGHCLYTNYNGPPWEEGWNPVYHNFSTIPEGEIVKISTECLNVEIIRSILTRYPELHLYENSGESWKQIMHRNATKINAVRFISEYLRINISHIVAFGDDYNDVEIIKHCGIGVAVDNAIASAKQVADYICSSNNDDGVAHWISEHVLYNE